MLDFNRLQKLRAIANKIVAAPAKVAMPVKDSAPAAQSAEPKRSKRRRRSGNTILTSDVDVPDVKVAEPAPADQVLEGAGNETAKKRRRRKTAAEASELAAAPAESVSVDDSEPESKKPRRNDSASSVHAAGIRLPADSQPAQPATEHQPAYHGVPPSDCAAVSVVHVAAGDKPAVPAASPVPQPGCLDVINSQCWLPARRSNSAPADRNCFLTTDEDLKFLKIWNLATNCGRNPFHEELL